jgi:hypothetical protein
LTHHSCCQNDPSFCCSTIDYYYSIYIQQKVHDYINIKSKVEKTQFVNDTVHDLRRQGYRFLAEDAGSRCWFDIGDAQTKNKVGHSLRDQVAAIRKAVVVVHVGGSGFVGGVAQEPSSSSETGSVVVDENNRMALGKRTMAAAGAHVALQEQAMSTTDVYDNLFATTTDTTTTATTSTTTPAATTPAATTTTTTTSAAGRPSAAKKPRLNGEDKVQLVALRTRLNFVMADLQHERHENGRLTDENAHLRQAADQSRGECVTLQTQVSNLSAVVRELWSLRQQNGAVVDLRFLSADAVQVVTQLVDGLPPPPPTAPRRASDENDGDFSATAADIYPALISERQEMIPADRPVAQLE